MKIIFFVMRLLVLWLCLTSTYVSATTFTPKGDVIGTVAHYTVKQQDNLYKIARQFDLGIVELLAANPGIDPWMPEDGIELVIPTAYVLPNSPHHGIVINLCELRLFYYAADGGVMTFPIGIGRMGWETPIGTTKILRKRNAPIWTPPPSIRQENPNLPDAFPPSVDNPLGEYALDLGFNGILIHGTNRPYGVGKRSSHGCIRLYPEDINILFNVVSVNTPVTIIDTVFKLGWINNNLLLEIAPTQVQTDEIAKYHQPSPLYIPEIYDAIGISVDKAGKKRANLKIHWHKIDQALAERNGIPIIIGTEK